MQLDFQARVFRVPMLFVQNADCNPFASNQRRTNGLVVTRYPNAPRTAGNTGPAQPVPHIIEGARQRSGGKPMVAFDNFRAP